MVKEAMLVRITCQRESADQVAAGIREMFQSFDQRLSVTVADIPGYLGRRLIVIETGRPYTDEDALDIFGEPGYDALTRYPGVLTVEAISSLADRPQAMTEIEANRLADRIRQDAPFLQRVTVKPAHSVNEDFTPDEGAFICWIEGLSFCSEIYNATEWGQLALPIKSKKWGFCPQSLILFPSIGFPCNGSQSRGMWVVYSYLEGHFVGKRDFMGKAGATLRAAGL